MRARKDSKFHQIGERKLKLSNFKAKPLREGDFEKVWCALILRICRFKIDKLIKIHETFYGDGFRFQLGWFSINNLIIILIIII
jgi:hypothetical protein